MVYPCLSCYVRLPGIELTVVFFQGYQVFTRGDSTWAEGNATWGTTLVPWMMIIGLSLLTLGWYAYQRREQGGWGWQIPSLRAVDITSGATPLVTSVVIFINYKNGG